MARTVARARRTPVHATVLALVAGMFALVGTALVAAPAQAAGTPDLQLTGGPATTVLYGRTVPVDLTAALPAGAPKGYNLAFRFVLPTGTTYVAGSAGAADGEPTIIANAPTSGKTTLIWPNVDDLVASSSHTVSFQVDYPDTSAATAPRYDVGDALTFDAGAYLSTDPRDETDFDSLGQATAGTDSYTGSATLTGATQLTAIQIRKSEPHPEGEIPRGVHDHQTVYTLTITNNEVNPTNAVAVDDYLPAGLEFLGCAGTPDHSSAEEYPGSGPIVVTHPTAAEGCVQPDLVETVSTDPDGTGPLPAGVYTHVRWNLVGDFAASQVRTLTYGAAIPIRENTMTWSGATPATTGAQTANLDNNSGPETYDEQELLNGAIAAGTYQAPAKPGLPVSDEGTLLRTAEDIAIQKSNNLASLDQGDLTRWTVDVQVSEYRYVTDLVIHDVVPNGLCPLGTSNLTHATSGSDSECAPVAGKLPSQPYTSVTEQGNGTFDITWDKSTWPALADIAPSGTRQLTFWTRTRANYQSGFADSTPVLSRDSVRNDIDTTGLDWVRCAPADPECTGSGTLIDHDEANGTPDTDVSGSGKTATGPVILKQVAAHFPGSGQCSNLAAAAYGKTVPSYGPGDHVCWKLRLDFPAGLDTSSQDVFDILPAGIDYVPGSWSTTSADTVPVGSIDTTTAGRLRWPIGAGDWDVDSGSQVFEVTFESTVGSPLGHSSGDVEGNLQKFSYVNTAGTAFTLRDRTDFQLAMPQLALVKGVRQVNSGTVNGPNTDHVRVVGGDVVQYRVDVSNTGPKDAANTRVWDVLPTGITCSDVITSSISNGGTCNTTKNRIQWSGVAVAHGASATLTYQVTVPVGVSPAQTFTNTAGVVSYDYVTNTGDTYQLVPDNSVVKDTSLAPNTKAAQDVSDIYTASAMVAKTRTTAVTETGNATADEAAIGERIDYTVTVTIPKGTTLYGTPTVVDALGARQQLVPGTLCSPACTLDGAALPSGVTVTESPANTVRATFPATYANTTGHDVPLVLRFSATVLDVAANTRGTTLPNTATLTFTDQGGTQRTASGSVSTRIVEPELALAKSHTPAGRVSPDAVLIYKLRVSNHADTTTTYYSPAHDLTVVDTLPAGTDPVDLSGNPIADGGTVPGDGGVWNATARTITWTRSTTPALAALDPGATTELTYQVRVEHAPVGGGTYVNNADVTSSSLDGPVAGERTSASTASTSGAYAAHATDTVAVALPSVTKSVTPDPTTIGTAVTWHLRVTVPAHVQYYDTTVVDTASDGLDVDGYGAATCVSGCPGGDPAIATVAPSTFGSSVRAAWFLGDLAPAATDRVYDLVLTGHVRDTYRSSGARVKDGHTLTNSADVRTNRTNVLGASPAAIGSSYSDTTTPATADTHVREPVLAIDKSADKAPQVKPGEAMTYTVTVTNTGTWPAYDVAVTDQPDSELTDVVPVAGPGFVTDGWTAADPAMRWLVPGPIAPGASVTLTYTAKVKPAGSVAPGATVTNTAKVATYYGAPKSERDAAPGTTWHTYTGPDDTVTLTVSPYADIAVVKHADRTHADGGDVITWTIDVTNNGPSAAQNVVVTDDLPDHSVFVSVTPGTPTCARSGSVVTCTYGSIASGATKTITVRTQVKGLPGASSSVPEHEHQLTIDKTEQYLTLAAGQVQTVDLSCANGGFMSDGSVEVLHVDQGTGSPADVLVRQASSTAPGTYRFVVENTTTGQAQAKLFGTCLPARTEATLGHTHALDVSAPTSLDTGAMTVGRHTFTIPVSDHHQAIAPGIEVVSGAARLVASEPVTGGWSFTVEATSPAQATLSLRELADHVLGAAPAGHQHGLAFTHVVRTVTLPPGESVQRVTCGDGSKGIVATYDLPAGVVLLGHEPQPINRDFRLLNTTGGDLTATLDLECLRIRTTDDVTEVVTITNHASATTTTYDPVPGNNESSDAVLASLAAGTGDQVVPLAVPVASSLHVAQAATSAQVAVRCSAQHPCSGTLQLTAKRKAGPSAWGGGQRIVIGTAHYRVKHGHRQTVRITIKKKYRSLVRQHRLHQYAVRSVRR